MLQEFCLCCYQTSNGVKRSIEEPGFTFSWLEQIVEFPGRLGEVNERLLEKEGGLRIVFSSQGEDSGGIVWFLVVILGLFLIFISVFLNK